MKSSLERRTTQPVGSARRGPGSSGAQPDDSLRALLPTTAETVCDVVALRRAAGGPASGLSREEKEQIIADARAGKLVSVVLQVVAFIQGEDPNRNFVRFTPGALRSLAPSFAGAPVLRNHDQHETASRAGRILSSKLEERDGDPAVKQIRMELELTAPWAVEDALRGLVDRFSIGWHSEGTTLCSVCGEQMTFFWGWTFGECDHQVGETYEGKVCQVEYTDGVGVETSIVNVPAVVGTAVDDMRAQRLAARTGRAPVLGRQETRPMKPFLTSILAALALSADTDEAGAVAGAEQLRTDLEGERAARRDAEVLLVTARGELDVLQLGQVEDRSMLLLKRGLDEGRFLPGSKVADYCEKQVQAAKLLAKGDGKDKKGNAKGALEQLERLELYIEDLPQGGAAPLRTPPLSLGKDPTPRQGLGGGGVTAAETLADLTTEDLAAAKRMSKTPEEYLELKKKTFPTEAAA